MSDSKKKYEEMVEDGEIPRSSDIRPTHEYKSMTEVIQEVYKEKFERTKYIWVLDFTDGKIYRYNVRALCNEDNEWNPDSESCEAFLLGAGHKINSIEWMVTNNETWETD